MERSTSNISYLQTAGRALEILKMYQTDHALALGTIASRMGLSTTVAYRLLYTLTAEGFLYQDPDTKKYLLGDQAIILGFCNVHRQNVKRIARDLMLDFYEQTGYSLTLTIPCNRQSLCVERMVSSASSRLTTIFLGSLLPLHLGATNRVLLAFFQERKREEYLSSLTLQEDEMRELRTALELARQRGYDYSRGTLNRGLYGIAFPVFNADNNLVAGISIGGAAAEVAIPENLETRIKDLRSLADAINERMRATVPTNIL